MHELSLCESIISSLREQFSGDDLTGIREIHLRIGHLSNVEPGILIQAFGFLVKESPFPDAVLFAEYVPVVAACEACGARFAVQHYRFICPECGEPSVTILEGNELKIHKIVIETKEPDPDMLSGETG